MTSTNTFQGLDEGSKPSSRVLRPPGGGSSDIFGGFEDDAGASRRRNKMASSIFAPAEAAQGLPKRSNPPGGKSSGIFGEPEAASSQPKVVPSGVTSNIFGGADPNPPAVKSHPNKPKDNISVNATVPSEPPAAAPEQSKVEEVKEVAVSPPPTPKKEAQPPAPTTENMDADPAGSLPTNKDHEPRLGPRPRSHNRVLNPPGGKSSVVFY